MEREERKLVMARICLFYFILFYFSYFCCRQELELLNLLIIFSPNKVLCNLCFKYFPKTFPHIHSTASINVSETSLKI